MICCCLLNRGKCMNKLMKNKGFTLIEIVVVISIMIVLLAVLAPFLLRYVENSRMQKDESAMDEVVNAVHLAMSDANIFDEVTEYLVDNNYLTYTDSSGVYGAKYTDEEYWAPDGHGKAMTITFSKNEDGNYVLSEGQINNITLGNSAIVTTRNIATEKQGFITECEQLYARVASTIEPIIVDKSATYKNSNFTIFITIDSVKTMKRANVYGEWNGTNLTESSTIAPTPPDNTLDDEETDPTTPPNDAPQPTTPPADLGGSGSATPSSPPEEEPPVNRNPEQESVDNLRYCSGATLSNSKLEALVIEHRPKRLIFTSTGRETGVDVSKEGNKKILAWIENETLYASVKDPGYYMPMGTSMDNFFRETIDMSNRTDIGYSYVEYMDVSICDTSKVTSMSGTFYGVGYSANSFKIVGLENWDVSKVTNMYAMFYGAGGHSGSWYLSDISNWNTSNVKNMSAMFRYACREATTWHMPNIGKWDMRKVENANYMFYGAGSHLTNFHLDLSNWSLPSLKTADSMFWDAGWYSKSFSLGNIKNWNPYNLEDAHCMFYCTGVYAYSWDLGDISGWNTSKCTDMSAMFYWAGRNADYNLDLSRWNVSNVTNHNNFAYQIGGTIIEPHW